MGKQVLKDVQKDSGLIDENFLLRGRNRNSSGKEQFLNDQNMVNLVSALVVLRVPQLDVLPILKRCAGGKGDPFYS